MGQQWDKIIKVSILMDAEACISTKWEMKDHRQKLGLKLKWFIFVFLNKIKWIRISTNRVSTKDTRKWRYPKTIVGQNPAPVIQSVEKKWTLSQWYRALYYLNSILISRKLTNYLTVFARSITVKYLLTWPEQNLHDGSTR